MLTFANNILRPPHTIESGKVYLVGAGPGDPELLTVKALRLLRRADVVLYDALVCLELLEEARPDAELINVGKRAGRHTLLQAEINELLVAHALAGKQVVRLKGGDPFVFGRGGEEALALYNAGIDFEVVPGVSSSIAAAAYAGVPVTHRDYTSSFTVITGHENCYRSPNDSRLDWDALAKVGGTLVFLMGIGRLAEICTRLQEAGLCSSTPVALVENGTTRHQRTVTGTLVDIAERGQTAAIVSPAIIIVGQVVNLHEQLSWFKQSSVIEG